MRATELLPDRVYTCLVPLYCLKAAGPWTKRNPSPESVENPAWHSESQNPPSQSAGAAGTVGEKEELKLEAGVS